MIAQFFFCNLKFLKTTKLLSDQTCKWQSTSTDSQVMTFNPTTPFKDTGNEENSAEAAEEGT